MATINKCAKCGACTSVCPVYRVTGQESHTARGRIHLLAKLTKKKQTDNYKGIFSKCLLCGACYNVCPRAINIPILITNARNNGAVPGGIAKFKKLLIQKFLSHPAIIPALGGTLKIGGNILPYLLPKESGLYLKLSITKEISSGVKPGFVNTLKINTVSSRSKVAYFAGCLANYLQQDIASASINLLDNLCETEVLAPQNQICCGMAAYASGDYQEAIKLAKRNITSFTHSSCSELPIFTSCATCYAHLKFYPELLSEDPGWQQKAKLFAERVCEFSSFILDNIVTSAKLSTGAGLLKDEIFYHDPCHLRFSRNGAQKITQQPRKLMTMLGITTSEPPQFPLCCGQGGLFNIAHPSLSNEICDKLISGCIDSNIKMTVTTCSGCLIQIQRGFARHNSRTKAVHLAILLRNQLK